MVIMKPENVSYRGLTGRDVGRIATLCERVHYTNPGESFLNHSFVILKDILPSTQFSVDCYRTNPLVLEEALYEGVSDKYYPVYETYFHQHPLLHLFMGPGRTSVSTIHSEISAADFRKKDLYQEFYRKVGVEDQLAFNLPYQGGVYVVVYSRDSAFTEKEQAIMQLLSPQLQISLKNWQRVRDLEQRLQLLEEKNVVSEAAAGQARQAKLLMDHLSPRQRDVAEQVAQGFENRKIAEILHISPKTVGKHLENIFETLDIHHRAALAALCRESGAIR